MANEGPKSSLIEAFLSGIDVSQKLKAKCDRFPRDIEIFIDLVLEVLSKTSSEPFQFSFHPRNYQAEIVLGNIEAYENKADIIYDLDQTVCWRRFIVVKEICHLLFAPHGEKHFASTPEQVEALIDNLLAGLSSIDIENNHIASTETCTIFMAVEILLPHSEREVVKRYINEGLTHLDVARIYRVPVVMLKIYLNEHYGKNMTMSYQMAGLG